MDFVADNEKKGKQGGGDEESQLKFRRQPQVEQRPAILWVPCVRDNPSQSHQTGSQGGKMLQTQDAESASLMLKPQFTVNQRG